MKSVLFLLVVFLTNIIQAITGFAGTMLAMPASMMLIGVNEARAVLNVMGLLSCLIIVIRNHRAVAKNEFGKISATMTVGMAAGLFLIAHLDIDFLLPLYGCFIAAVALKKLFIKRDLPLPGWAMTVTLLSAGVIHGMFISGGSLLVIYAAAVFKEKSIFRSTLSAVWVFLNTILLVSHIKSGYFTPEVVRLTLLSILPLILAVRLGSWLHSRVKQQTFLKMTYILLLISGILILR